MKEAKRSALLALKAVAAAVVVAYTLSIVPGCALLGEPIAEKVADVIDDYCKEPLSARQVYRDTVNRELAAEGHSVSVTCAGDPVAVP